jgi:hypothetical protein
LLASQFALVSQFKSITKSQHQLSKINKTIDTMKTSAVARSIARTTPAEFRGTVQSSIQSTLRKFGLAAASEPPMIACSKTAPVNLWKQGSRTVHSTAPVHQWKRGSKVITFGA